MKTAMSASNSEVLEITLLTVCLGVLLLFVFSMFQYVLTGDAYLVPFVNFICGNPSAKELLNAQ